MLTRASVFLLRGVMCQPDNPLCAEAKFPVDDITLIGTKVVSDVDWMITTRAVDFGVFRKQMNRVIFLVEPHGFFLDALLTRNFRVYLVVLQIWQYIPQYHEEGKKVATKIEIRSVHASNQAKQHSLVIPPSLECDNHGPRLRSNIITVIVVAESEQSKVDVRLNQQKTYYGGPEVMLVCC